MQTKPIFFILILMVINIGCSMEGTNEQPKETATPNVVEEKAMTKEEKRLKEIIKETEKQVEKEHVVEKKLVKETASSSDISKNYLMGKFDPNEHPDFVTIASKYASRSGMRLRKETYNAFLQMYEAAQQDGISLKIISATRNFYSQKSIWEAKWNGTRKVDGRMLPASMPGDEKALKILRYSSMPGSSRHHWGTDIDLNNLNNSYFEQGTGKKIYDWLTTHANEYGFCQPYSVMDATRPNGYQEEKWHWSYTPISKSLTTQYQNTITNTDITGFKGAETAGAIKIIENYVLGINPDCR